MALILLLLALYLILRRLNRKKQISKHSQSKKTQYRQERIENSYQTNWCREKSQLGDAYQTDWDSPIGETYEKGQYGERRIERILKEYQINHKSEAIRIFKNLYVPYGGGTSEIDLVMIHEKGVFVFESKFYGGWIYGSSENLKWTHVFPNGEKYKFYNPIKQNQTHIKALSRYLKLSPEYFYSYIIFSNQCVLKLTPDCYESVTVIYQSQLIQKLRDDLSGIKPNLKLKKETVQQIADRLLPLTNVNEEIKKRHIAQVQNFQSGSICPFCGGKLVRRKGPYGEFWGCVAYPKCKFKREIEG